MPNHLRNLSRWRVALNALLAYWPLALLVVVYDLAASVFIADVFYPLDADFETLQEYAAHLQSPIGLAAQFASPMLSALLGGVLAAFAHHYALNVAALGDGETVPVGQRIVAFLALVVLVNLLFAPATVLSVTAGPQLLAPEEASPEAMEALFGLAVLVSVASIVGLVIILMIATVFPAIIHRGDASIAAAWRRGGALRLALRFATPILIFIAALFVLTVVIGVAFFDDIPQQFAGDLTAYLNSERAFQTSAAGLVTTGSVSLLGVYLIAVLSVTLSEHYLRREEHIGASAV